MGRARRTARKSLIYSASGSSQGVAWSSPTIKRVRDESDFDGTLDRPLSQLEQSIKTPWGKILIQRERKALLEAGLARAHWSAITGRITGAIVTWYVLGGPSRTAG